MKNQKSIRNAAYRIESRSMLIFRIVATIAENTPSRENDAAYSVANDAYAASVALGNVIHSAQSRGVGARRRLLALAVDCAEKNIADARALSADEQDSVSCSVREYESLASRLIEALGKMKA